MIGMGKREAKGRLIILKDQLLSVVAFSFDLSLLEML